MRLFPAKSVFLYFIKFNIMIIIGITGTLGAGKGTIVEYLIKNKNFFHFNISSNSYDNIGGGSLSSFILIK